MITDIIINTTLIGISPTGRPKPKVNTAKPKPPATPKPIPLKRPPIAKQTTITASSNQKLIIIINPLL